MHEVTTIYNAEILSVTILDLPNKLINHLPVKAANPLNTNGPMENKMVPGRKTIPTNLCYIITYTSIGGYCLKEKSCKHWSLFTKLLSSVTAIFFSLLD